MNYAARYECRHCAARFFSPIRLGRMKACPICHGLMEESEPFKSRSSPKNAKLLARDGDRCWLCGNRLGDSVTRDHVIPRSKGGSNALDNLRLAHARCNSRRGNADPPAGALARLAA